MAAEFGCGFRLRVKGNSFVSLQRLATPAPNDTFFHERVLVLFGEQKIKQKKLKSVTADRKSYGSTEQ